MIFILSFTLARTPTEAKNATLLALANALDSTRAEVLAANALDVPKGAPTA